MSSAIKGIDVSSWQHQDNQEIYWEFVYEHGYRFAVVKATQGTSYVNPWVARDLSDAAAAGLLVGAYHYYEAGDDPQQQAKWFTSCLDDLHLDLGAFIDWDCYLPAKFVHTQELTQCLNEVRTVRPQCGTRVNVAWATSLQEESVQLGRLWVEVRDDEATPACFMWESDRMKDVEGISSPVTSPVIQNTRGLDIPTAPPERPTPLTTHSVKALVEEEAEEAENDEHSESDDIVT